MAPHPIAGEPAPDFVLEGTQGAFTLSEHRGERVVLLFYPADDTPVCTRQFCSYRDDPEGLAALEATVVGISGGSVRSKHAFADKHRLAVPLLADPDRAVAKAYGAWSRLRGTRRAAIVIDEAGVVRHRHDHVLGLDFQSVGDIREALANLDEAA